MTKRSEDDADLAAVLEELKAREPIFHRPEWGTTRADYEGMMMPDFWEVGASGQRYSREVILEELERRAAAPRVDVWETSEFRCQELSDNLYLLTYTLLQGGVRLTRRATLWQRTPEGWRIAFHQGTIAQDRGPQGLKPRSSLEALAASFDFAQDRL